MIDAAIIGGSGVGAYLSSLGGEPVGVSTAFGLIRGTVIPFAGHRILLLPRHGPGHKVPPHSVNYRGMARAIKELGGRFCFSTAAVGSLTVDIPVGSLVVCDGMIDATARNQTMFENSVQHVPLPDPFDSHLRTSLVKVLGDTPFINGGCYLGANGPRFETPSEIQMYRKWGGDLVGMTASTEAVSMAEAGVPYALLAIVTNLGCGLSEIPPSDEEVQVMMRAKSPEIADTLLRACALHLDTHVSKNS